MTRTRVHSEFLEPASPRWSEALTAIAHDVVHEAEFVRFAARRFGEGSTRAYLAEEHACRFFVPFFQRPVRSAPRLADGSWFDVTSTDSGPLVAVPDPSLGAEFTRRALGAFLDALRDQGVIACFLWLHPILTPPLEPFTESGRVVTHKSTVVVDLTQSVEELWHQTRPNHRRDINRAARQGHVARVDTEWKAFDSFVEMYQETMLRAEANPYWHFSREHFRELREVLGERLHLCVVEIGGKVASAGMFTECCGIVNYFLSGTRTAFLSQRPAKTMLHFMRGWAKERGNRLLHLGGGVLANDSLFDFKIGFSPLTRPVLSWRAVLEPAAYAELVAEWESRHGAPADGLDGFFPAYRKQPP